MLRWLVKKYLEGYVNELVDRRFETKLHERKYEQTTEQIRARITELKKILPVSKKETKSTVVVQPSSVLEVPDRTQSRLQTETNQASVKKAAEMDALRAKLTGARK
jgi:hypothetical protein